MFHCVFTNKNGGGGRFTPHPSKLRLTAHRGENITNKEGDYHLNKHNFFLTDKWTDRHKNKKNVWQGRNCMCARKISLPLRCEEYKGNFYFKM